MGQIKQWLIRLEDQLADYGIKGPYDWLYEEPMMSWLNEQFAVGYSIDHIVDEIDKGKYPQYATEMEVDGDAKNE